MAWLAGSFRHDPNPAGGDDSRFTRHTAAQNESISKLNIPVVVDSTIYNAASKLVREAQALGALGDVDWGTVTRAEIHRSFYGIDFETKTTIARSISYLAKFHGFSGLVKFTDDLTGKTVAEYNVYLGELKWR